MAEQQNDRLLEEMVYYLRDIASFFRRDELAELLADQEQRVAYELSNGKRSSTEIKSEGNINKSPRTIQNWWSSWVEAGIADRTEDGKARAKYTTSVIRAPEGE